jgi:hypothetical protein
VTNGRETDPGSRPVPDPTVLTTEALQREVLALRESLNQRISGLRELVEEELEGNDKVTEERFASIDTQLQLIERQRVEQKTDTKSALEAALSAAEKAVKEQTTASEARTDKSEASTTKSIDQLAATFDTAFQGLRRDLDDLKTRMTTVEQQKVGRSEEGQTHLRSQVRREASIGQIIALAAIGVTFFLGIAGLAIALVLQ